MSLRDQLLKAGLVSKKQTAQADAQKRKQEHDSKKNKELEDKLKQQKAAELKVIEDEAEKRRELDKELNKARDLMVAQREGMYRAKHILNSQNLNQKDAQEAYFFAEGNVVRKVMVTPWQREMLARGKLGIGRPLDDVDEFVIVPLEAAKLVQEVCPAKIIVLFPETEDIL